MNRGSLNVVKNIPMTILKIIHKTLQIFWALADKTGLKAIQNDNQKKNKECFEVIFNGVAEDFISRKLVCFIA